MNIIGTETHNGETVVAVEGNGGMEDCAHCIYDSDCVKYKCTAGRHSSGTTVFFMRPDDAAKAVVLGKLS